MSKRNGFLDIVKGAATVMVLITHYNWSDKWRLNLLFPYWVSMAVPLFMIITGYLSAASLERSGVKTLRAAYELKPLFKKIARYTLPFLYMYIVEIIIRSLSGNMPSPLSVLVYFFGGGFGEYGTYYFPVLIQITLIFPLIFFVVRSNKKWGLLVCFVLNLGLEIIKNVVDMSGGVYRLLAFRYIFVVAAGCYIYFYGNTAKYYRRVLACAVGALYIWLVNYTSYEPKIFIFWTATTMLTTFFVAPVFAYFVEGKPLHCAPLELIGRACYHIFLAQIIFYNYVAPHIYRAVESKALELLLCLTISLVMGLGYYYIYNKIKKAKGFFRVAT